MPEGLARYGLRPAKRPFGSAVDPLARPVEMALFVQQKNYIRLEQIDSAIEQSLQQVQPAFFLVVGSNGTGRTSAANCILARYVAKLAVAPAHLLVPRDGSTKNGQRILNHDRLAAFTRWMAALRAEIVLTKRISLPGTLGAEFAAEVKDAVLATMGPTFQALMLQVTDAVRNHMQPHAIACCLEDVPTFDFISTAQEVFRDTSTVCVFTAEDYDPLRNAVIKPFSEKLVSNRDHLIHLQPVGGNDVATLLDARWRLETAVPNPFDPVGLEAGFGDALRPIGRVMTLVERMLTYKVTRFNVGPPYPDDQQLFFPKAEIVGLVAAVDN